MVYAIKRGSLYLQGIAPNEHYSASATAPTMGARHAHSEFRTEWKKQPVYFERLTVAGYMAVVLEEYRWGDLKPTKIEIVPKENEKC